MTTLSQGDLAPDFDLPLGSGGTLRLSSLRGRQVVVYFYPKDNTTGCSLEAREFTTLKPAFEAADTTVVGVSPDSVKSHANFTRKQELAIDLVSDADLAAANAYGVWVEKSMYGRSYMGVERATYLIGRDGRIRQIWRKVKAAGHAAEVLEAARAPA